MNARSGFRFGIKTADSRLECAVVPAVLVRRIGLGSVLRERPQVGQLRRSRADGPEGAPLARRRPEEVRVLAGPRRSHVARPERIVELARAGEPVLWPLRQA